MITYQRKGLKIRAIYSTGIISLGSAWHYTRRAALVDLVHAMYNHAKLSAVIERPCKYNGKFNCPQTSIPCERCGVYLYNREVK